MLWINFLHLYQPVNKDDYFIREATDMSYARVIRALEEHPSIRFTLNIQGSLWLRWMETGHDGLMKRIAALVKRGQIELTGSAAYHPILPLIPEKEVIKQIKENEKIIRDHLGFDYRPQGFFFPEMAYSRNVAKLVKDLGYKWIILDEIAYNGKLNQVDFAGHYFDKGSGLKVVFRSRKYSNSFVPSRLGPKRKKQNTYITATDAELYGLRHTDPDAYFESLLKSTNIETKTISEFIICSEEKERTMLKPCSWESTETEIAKGIYYALWYDKGNKIQSKLWHLASTCYRAVEEGDHDQNYKWARWHLVRGLASCVFWWASGHDFKKSFGPLAWNPDEVVKGIDDLIRSVRSLRDPETRELKIETEKLALRIKELIWEKHWSEYWRK